MSPVTQVWKTLETILDVLTSTPCALDPLPCRVAVYPGGIAAWHSCGGGCGDGTNGQLWANLQSLEQDLAGTTAGSCTSYVWNAQIGIVRCAAPMAADGNAPSVGAVQADSWFQAVDADLIRSALLCCTDVTEEQRLLLEDIVFTAWEPFGPDGGCVGGAWSIQGRLSDCCGPVPLPPDGVDRAQC